jgi:hypothetical protein
MSGNHQLNFVNKFLDNLRIKTQLERFMALFRGF